MTKWYMHNPSKRMKHKIPGDFEIQTAHLILAGKPNRVLINKKKKKKNLLFSGFCHTDGSPSKKKRKPKNRRLLKPSQRTET